MIKEKFGISIKAILVGAAFLKIITWDKLKQICIEDDSPNGSFYAEEHSTRFEFLLNRAILEKKIDRKTMEELGGEVSRYEEIEQSVI